MKNLNLLIFAVFATSPLVTKAQVIGPFCNKSVAPGGDINLAMSQAAGAGGGRVCLSAGTYVVPGELAVPGSVILYGNSGNRSTVILKRSGSSDSPVVSFASGTSAGSVRNLTLDGSGVAGYGILVYQAQQVNISNIAVDHVKSIPVGIVDSHYVDVENSYFGPDLGSQSFVSPHFWITNSTNFSIHGSDLIGKQRTSSHEGDGGIALYGSSNINIYENYIYRAGTYYASSGSIPTSYAYVWGNTFEYANEWPLDVVEGANNIFISSNYIRNAFHGAMVLWNSSSIEVSYNVMENNNVGGHASCQAINNRNSSNLNIHNNTASPAPVMCNY